MRRLLLLIGLWLGASQCLAAPAVDPALQGQLPAIRQLFADAMLDQRLPGVVYGIVVDGRLVHVEGLGVQDLEHRAPITADSRFRIASMTKAFTALTILKLRDEGRLRLDDPASRYVPELAGWAPATPDSRTIAVSDLLHHSAGFVTDDPWGDRQQPLPQADFTGMLAAGVPFTRATGTAFEYSNLGYAILGRIIANSAGQPYARAVAASILAPLGMASSGFELDTGQPAARTRGYRFEDGAFAREPDMSAGAFESMGGMITTANDYARWMGLLLSGWPPAAGPQAPGIAPRATLRDMAHGNGFPQSRIRPGKSGAAACRLAAAYGMGLIVAQDCDLGLVMFHGGGYPGYGSHMLLMPEAGVGLFAFANRTYAPVSGPVWDAALLLAKAGVIRSRGVPASAALAASYRTAGEIYAAGRIDVAADRLAANMLMDRSAPAWQRELARLRKEVGECDTGAAIEPTGVLSGRFRWTCAIGRLDGQLLLAPTPTPQIQALRLSIVG